MIFGNTLQDKDYSKFSRTMVDPAQKQTLHEESFGVYLQKNLPKGSGNVREPSNSKSDMQIKKILMP